MGFNTAIAAMMEAINELYRLKVVVPYVAAPKEWQAALETLLQLLAPFAPHITEELWHQLGHAESVHLSAWPTYDESHLVEDSVTIAIQVNGKLRGEVTVSADTSEVDVIAAAQDQERVKAYTEGKTILKTIYVPGRIVNVVVK